MIIINLVLLYYLYLILTVSVESANLKSSGGIMKPHPYVELNVDDYKRHKSEIVRNTYQPKWNNEFTVYVYVS